MSHPNNLPRRVGTGRRWSARESWRMFGIMSEFVEATDRLSDIRPAVSIFGSARIGPDHPHYMLAEQIARLLSDAGFSVISGGGPGVMEAADVDLMRVIDDPQGVVDAIFDFYEERGFEPSAAEREILLNL